MAQKRFGPTRAAGVTIIETEGDKTITPGALGFAGYAGMFEKGPTGEMGIMLSKSAFLRRYGSYIPESQAPGAAIDYFDGANGAGGVCVVRVTDGNEAKAELTLYTRNGTVRAPMGKLTAKNGGRWGGKELKKTATVTSGSDITEITIATGITMKVDEFKGGWVELGGVANKRWTITGNNAAGLVTVAADSTMKTEWTAGGGSDLRFYLYLDNDGKALAVRVRDGEEKPTEEFALDIYVDGALVSTYPNLSTDPASQRYWVTLINEDGANEEVTAVDLWTGAHTAAVRPASIYGKNSAVTTTTLTAIIHEFSVTTSPTGANPTAALGTTTDAMVEQTLTITLTSSTAFSVVSDKFGTVGTGTMGTLFTPTNKWTPPFTLTQGSTVVATSDVLKLVYKPLKASALINGRIFPDKVNAKRTFYRITANTHKVITVADGSDMTTDTTTGDEFQVDAALEMAGGRDGHSAVVDATYNQKAWDVSLSPFNRLEGKNMGLVKFATPGVTSTAVQKAGVAYAAAKNHQYRYEIPANQTTESQADAYVNETLGRSDYAVFTFPSYAYIADPLGGGQGKTVLVTMTGMIHGREAAIARDYDGYHKAAAGIDATLPKVLRLPTGDAILNEEYLNPLGINIVKKVKGNFVLWGDRTLSTDPAWKWKHQREQMSYYEHVLQEAFDWIVFMINDSITEKLALAALKSFFIPEFNKRALRGKTFEDAAIIKIDAENNTNLTRANGDMYADIKLRLADTVERFIIRIGKQGIFDEAA